jgi:hypothetical protein
MIDYALPSITLSQVQKKYRDAALKGDWKLCHEYSIDMVRCCQEMGEFAQMQHLGFSPTK